MPNQTEVWKLITGYPKYQVSNFGRVFGKHKLLKGSLIKGYPTVCLDNSYRIGIHILVCTMFHGPKPFEGAMALHRDDIKTHNYEDNLYWGTHAQNVEDSMRNNVRTFHTGENHYNAKLTWEKVAEIRQLRADGKKLKDIANQYGLIPQYVSIIVNNKAWVI